MIDTMVNELKVEQKDDDDKQTYCNTEFDTADDKKKGLEVAAADAQKAASTTENSIATLNDELKALAAGGGGLDERGRCYNTSNKRYEAVGREGCASHFLFDFY